LGRDIRDLKGVGICAIGPATAGAIEKRGIRVDIMPGEYVSEAVVDAFEALNMNGKKALLPRAEVARDVIPLGLSKLGAGVDVVAAYRTVNSGRKKSELVEMACDGKVDIITFTSPSTAANFMDIIESDVDLLQNVRIACIGPVTAAAVEKLGLKVDIMPESYTLSGLTEALAMQIKN
jgi:Uroporphyrinogen-III synthase